VQRYEQDEPSGCVNPMSRATCFSYFRARSMVVQRSGFLSQPEVTTASGAASSVDWCPRLILWFKWKQLVAEGRLEDDNWGIPNSSMPSRSG
jgi:hypothetical protein